MVNIMNYRICIDVIALVVLYIFIFRKRWIKKGKDVWLVNITMYAYLSFVLYFTLMPIITALPFIFNHPYMIYIDPFSDYVNGRGDSIRQIVLNVLMTIPFGFLYPITQKKRHRNLLRTMLFTALLSITIELVQPLIHGSRSCDVTDVITNTLGGVIGFFLYLLFGRIILHFLKRIKQVSD